MENENIVKTETTETTETEVDPKEAQRQEMARIFDPEEQIRRFGKGKMTLREPIRSKSEDVTELTFDFTALTGREYCDAMDMDQRAQNSFRLTATQAFNLFAVAAAKSTGNGLDATDIRSRMGAQDSVKAVQLATVFFTACNRAGNKRISNM